MSDPFAAGLGALFQGPGSAAAVYTSTGGVALPIRVIRDHGRQLLGGNEIAMDTDKVQIMRADIAQPRSGDLIVIGDEAERFTIQGVPQLSAERLTWSCELQPA